MKTGIIFNSLICLIIVISTLYTSLYIYKRNNNRKEDLALAFFWFFVSLTWLSVLVSLILYYNNLMKLDLIVNQFFVQTFVFAQITAGIYYGIYRVFKKYDLSLVGMVIFFFTSAVALYYAYQPGGIIFREGTYFSVEYSMDHIAWLLFQILAVSGMSFLFFDLLKSAFNKLTKNIPFESKYHLASAAIIIYGCVGYFDQRGYDATWMMVLFRLIMVFAVMIAYLAFSREEEKEKIQ